MMILISAKLHIGIKLDKQHTRKPSQYIHFRNSYSTTGTLHVLAFSGDKYNTKRRWSGNESNPQYGQRCCLYSFILKCH